MLPYTPEQQPYRLSVCDSGLWRWQQHAWLLALMLLYIKDRLEWSGGETGRLGVRPWGGIIVITRDMVL